MVLLIHEKIINERKRYKIMEYKKIVAILESGEVCSDIDNIQIIDDTDIVVDGTTWRILDNQEADEYFENYQKDLLRDLGLESFSSWAKDYVMENCVERDWFEDCMKESYSSYISDLRHDGLLEDEINEAEVKDEEELLEYLCNQWHDGVEWYIEQFGIDECELVIEQKMLYDVDKVIEYVKEYDGRGCIASYDGFEIELDYGYYGYRME
jgi:hypothetical protein